MYKQKIRVILKSGSEFVITCDSFEGEMDRGTGELLSYSCEGITENRPLYRCKHFKWRGPQKED